MKKLNTTQFRKKLGKLSQDDLVELIVDSCKASPMVYEFIRSRLDGDANVVNMALLKKWAAIPAEMRERILDNCFCSKCSDVVRMVDVTFKDDKFGLILVGKCSKCGYDVVRCLDE